MAYTTINDPSAHFHTLLYTGDGNSGRALTNSANAGDLQPDWVWIKKRSGGSARSHNLYDSTRGGTKLLHSNSDQAESTQNAGLTAFGTNGFTLGSDDGVNGSGAGTYVAWQWKANGGTRSTFTESGSNPAGGRQVNTTAGFSIIDYTGTGGAGTIAHGLGAIPKFWVIKNRSGSGWSWYVYHGANTSAPETDNLYLNNTDATLDDNTRWNDTAPTSTNITLGTNGGVNQDGETLICYAWAEIQGYSKFGGYTGNGNADGPFIYTGFKPAWIMIKRTDAAKNWYIADSKRSPSNVNKAHLVANSNAAEDTSGDGTDSYFDILSNGFKLRQDFSHLNADGGTFVYIAFAEHPFVSSEGVPCTAR